MKSIAMARRLAAVPVLFFSIHCAMMFQSGYETIVTATLGKRVELTDREKADFEANLDKARLLLIHDRFAWISTDSMFARFPTGLDTARLGMWVVYDSVVYYGKMETDGFRGAYEYDFRKGAVFFKESAPGGLPPEIPRLALAQEKAIALFHDYRKKYYSKFNVYSFFDGDQIEVYLLPSHGNGYHMVGGGLYSRWEKATLDFSQKRYLHKAAYVKRASEEKDMVIWNSESDAVLNEVDVFQAFQLKRNYNLITIWSGKYIFAHEGASQGLKFDVFGKEFLEEKIRTGKKH